MRASATDILRMRLSAQRLTTPADDVRTVVRDLLALQAQDFAQGLWALGVRTASATRSDVLAALADGSIVRTLAMRGTLHFVQAIDLRWMLTVTAERTMRSAASRFATLGLDTSTFDHAEDTVRAAIGGGGSLGRAAFMALLERNGISCEGQRGYHIIFALIQRRLLCWGPPDGKGQALVLVDEWIAAQPERDREDALREFALRYFSGHGPASVRDFAWWTKLTLSDARAGLSAAAAELVELEYEGERLWTAPSIVDAPRASGTVLALPGFDEFLLGYTNRGLPLAPEHFERIVPGSNGIFLPIVVSAGRVSGSWRRAPGSQIAAVEAVYFAATTTSERIGFDRAAQRYASFTLG
jgi:hypothetical protein